MELKAKTVLLFLRLVISWHQEEHRWRCGRGPGARGTTARPARWWRGWRCSRARRSPGPSSRYSDWPRKKTCSNQKIFTRLWEYLKNTLPSCWLLVEMTCTRKQFQSQNSSDCRIPHQRNTAEILHLKKKKLNGLRPKDLHTSLFSSRPKKKYKPGMSHGWPGARSWSLPGGRTRSRRTVSTPWRPSSRAGGASAAGSLS
mmetsp:Transcript_55681/g.81355  ORF Transcript_55681/g.81355 Transcript_55681/m.81355 type:complete len:200 (+) Transcript_55681:575-1174(+)